MKGNKSPRFFNVSAGVQSQEEECEHRGGPGQPVCLLQPRLLTHPGEMLTPMFPVSPNSQNQDKISIYLVLSSDPQAADHKTLEHFPFDFCQFKPLLTV